MKTELIEIAEALKYSKIERLKAFSKHITDETVNDILKASIAEPFICMDKTANINGKRRRRVSAFAE